MVSPSFFFYKIKIDNITKVLIYFDILYLLTKPYYMAKFKVPNFFFIFPSLALVTYCTLTTVTTRYQFLVSCCFLHLFVSLNEMFVTMRDQTPVQHFDSFIESILKFSQIFKKFATRLHRPFFFLLQYPPYIVLMDGPISKIFLGEGLKYQTGYFFHFYLCSYLLLSLLMPSIIPSYSYAPKSRFLQLSLLY